MSDQQVADDADAVPTGDRLTPTPPKKRGRPSGNAPSSKVEKKPETPQQVIDRLEAQLEKARETKKIADEERDLIVGRVLVADALADAEFRKQIASRLRKKITAKRELAAIAELLA